MQTRRIFLNVAAMGAGAVLLDPTSRAAGGNSIRAVAFDVFTIFDARSLDHAIEARFAGKGRPIGALWKDKLFEYFFLRTMEKRYADAGQVASEALRYACVAKGLDPNPGALNAIVDIFSHLKMWPDSAEALRRMHGAGLRLACLSNLTEAMLKSSIQGVGIAPFFEHYLSTDRVQAFKPDPRAYAMAEKAFALQRREVLFAATGGWDYTGSKAFGMETFWVDRSGSMPETLGIEPDGKGATLTKLADYAIARAT